MGSDDGAFTLVGLPEQVLAAIQAGKKKLSIKLTRTQLAWFFA